MTCIKRNAYGKVNLFLNVKPPKFNVYGKHTIESLFLRIPLCDTVIMNILAQQTVAVCDYDNKKSIYIICCGVTVACNCTVIYDSSIAHLQSSCILDENIVLRAIQNFLHYLDNYSKISHNVDEVLLQKKIPRRLIVKIHKRIPIASGLGGGSANAAATLMILYDIFCDILEQQDLYDIAANVGADVFFSLQRYNIAVVQGYGEVIKEAVIMWDCLGLNGLDDLYHRIILVNPGTSVSTAAVYSKFDALHYAKKNDVGRALTGDDGINNVIDDYGDSGKIYVSMKKCIMTHRKNDLMEAACNLYTDLSHIHNTIINASECIASGMSGSGGTFWGIFKNVESALGAAYAIRELHPMWWVYHQYLF